MWFLLLINVLISASLASSKKEDVLKHIGKYAYEVDYFPEARFTSVEFDSGETDRTGKDPVYADLYRRYLALGVKAQIEPPSSRLLASVARPATDQKLRFSVPQQLGLIAFKRGDLKEACPRVIRKARELGIDRIAYFHPVHYSGGNGGSYKMPSNPMYGTHWRYELTNHFSREEFEGCLDLIVKENLKLHFIPHLESIATLVEDREEWRLLSGIPIDDHYFHHSFGPLLSYLKKRPKAFRKSGSLHLTLAAEIDPMVIAHSRKARAGLAMLRSKLNDFGVTGTRVFLNTNGDFFNGQDLVAKSSVSCHDIDQLLVELDGLSPSVYGDKGHIKSRDGKLSLDETIKTYREGLWSTIQRFCPHSQSIQKRISEMPIAFGEFAIDSKNASQSYFDILQDAKGKLQFLVYWNHGEWDHLGVLGDGDEKAKSELLVAKKTDKRQ